MADGSTQRMNKIIEGCIARQIAAAGIEPSAGLAKMAVNAVAIVALIVASQVAVREVDLALDGPARVLEQRDDVARQRS